MCAPNLFCILVICNCVRIKRLFRASVKLIYAPSSFSTDSFKAVPLIYFFITALLLSFLPFALSLFVLHRCFFRWL